MLDIAVERDHVYPTEHGAFAAAARARGLAITLIDHAEAPHSFDLVDDSPATHAVIDDVLAFLRRSLT